MKRTLLTLAAALGLAAAPAGQSARFDGWERMADVSYHFDPDERAVLPFALQTSPAARAALERADGLLRRGQPGAAARELLDAGARFGAELIQVADEPGSGGGGRWVGAGEWALYQLMTRVPATVLAEVATPEERLRLARATTWRDQRALHELSSDLDALPQGRAATVTLARLSAESGDRPAAAAAGRRAVQLGAPLPVPSPWAAHTPAPVVSPLQLASDETILSTWPRWGSAWLGNPTTLSRLVDGGRRPRHNPFTGSANMHEAPFAPLEPVVRDGVVYVTDALSVSALDLVSGRQLWHHQGPLERVDPDGRWGESFDIGVYANIRRERAISPYLLARPTLAGERLLVSLQATQPWHELHDFDNVPINHPLPARRLVCLDRRSGEPLWRQERPELGPEAFVNRLDVDGPPLVSGGVVYVAGSITEGAINAYAAAFDLASGELRWHTLLCTGQQELTMFNRPFQEHVLAPPALHDGQLLINTNLGVVVSLDLWSGRLRWVSAYEAMRRRSSRMVRPNTARTVYWRSEPPFVEGGVLVFAPLDSEWLLGIDPSTGRRRWRVNALQGSSLRSAVRHQAVPTGDGRVILVSDTGTECVQTASGDVVWTHQPFSPYDEVSGAALLAGDELLVPADPFLLVVDSASGRVKASHALPATSARHVMQRVLPAGPVLVMTDGASVLAYGQAQQLRLLHEPLAAAGDQRSALALAELELASQHFDEATLRFTDVAARAGAELAARARSGLLAAAWSRARQDDTPEAWAAVMRAAPDAASLPALADDVLPALARLGAHDLLVRWLKTLAESAPQHPVDLGRDGPRPASQALVLQRLPLEPPAVQVELLSQLISHNAPGSWEGRPTAETAALHIAELIGQHGRGIYAVHEAAALALADSGASLEVVARLYPNAELVERRRVERMQAMLADGRAGDVFVQAAGSASAAILALRARAARELGERAFADALEGRAAPVRSSAPVLPPDGSGTITLAVHTERDVSFEPVAGSASPEYAGHAVGVVDGLGELFCIDTRAGELLWQGVGLPGGARSIRAGVDLTLHDDLLLVRGRNELLALGLDDGLPRWSRVLVGSVRKLESAQGLLFTLLESSLGEWRVEAYGMTTGLAAFRYDLPGVEDAWIYRAGEQIVCLSTGRYEAWGSGKDRRLLVLDPARGGAHSFSPLEDGQQVISVSHDPPALFLGQRRGSGLRLSAWNPVSRETAWEVELNSIPTSHHLFASAPGWAVLRERVSLPGSRSR
ncbi:MAG: hypothetical protein DRQ55_18565, partial [Planctomycetota bacterium]